MSRRQQPPKHPITGDPLKDNELRRSWREYRDYLSDPSRGPLVYRHAGFPRKQKKARKKIGMSRSFIYHPVNYYKHQSLRELR